MPTQAAQDSAINHQRLERVSREREDTYLRSYSFLSAFRPLIVTAIKLAIPTGAMALSIPGLFKALDPKEGTTVIESIGNVLTNLTPDVVEPLIILGTGIFLYKAVDSLAKKPEWLEDNGEIIRVNSYHDASLKSERNTFRDMAGKSLWEFKTVNMPRDNMTSLLKERAFLSLYNSVQGWAHIAGAEPIHAQTKAPLSTRIFNVVHSVFVGAKADAKDGGMYRDFMREHAISGIDDTSLDNLLEMMAPNNNNLITFCRELERELGSDLKYVIKNAGRFGDGRKEWYRLVADTMKETSTAIDDNKLTKSAALVMGELNIDVSRGVITPSRLESFKEDINRFILMDENTPYHDHTFEDIAKSMRKTLRWLEAGTMPDGHFDFSEVDEFPFSAHFEGFDTDILTVDESMTEEILGRMVFGDGRVKNFKSQGEAFLTTLTDKIKTNISNSKLAQDEGVNPDDVLERSLKSMASRRM